MSQQAQNDHYADGRSLALAYAEAVNEELHDLKAAERTSSRSTSRTSRRPEPAREYALEAINRALAGIEGDTVLHTCFGYAHIVHDRLPVPVPRRAERLLRDPSLARGRAAQPRPRRPARVSDKVIVLGVLDLGSSEVESPEVVADRIRKALTVLPPERLVPAPDCGMKYLPRERAFRKLEAMVAGARLVDDELERRHACRSVSRATLSPASARPIRTGSRCVGTTSRATSWAGSPSRSTSTCCSPAASRPRTSASSSTCSSSRSPSTG